jgi:hypothetical protein
VHDGRRGVDQKLDEIRADVEIEEAPLRRAHDALSKTRPTAGLPDPPSPRPAAACSEVRGSHRATIGRSFAAAPALLDERRHLFLRNGNAPSAGLTRSLG